MVRVLVADDHAVVREGLRLFLDLQEGIEVIGEARTARRPSTWPPGWNLTSC